MKNRGLHILLAFLSLIVASGLACSALTGSPTSAPAPTVAPPPTQASVATEAPAPTKAPAGTQSSSTGSDLVTFTDKNNLYQIDLPSDWTHSTVTEQYDYIDTFTAPDRNAKIENIMYDDGSSWSGKNSGKAALFLLNRYYSNTGAEGDIRVTEEKQQKDGSDRLTWTSKSGGYSGVTFFEVRGNTTLLVFTAWYANSAEKQYQDILNNVISSYRVP